VGHQALARVQPRLGEQHKAPDSSSTINVVHVGTCQGMVVGAQSGKYLQQSYHDTQG